MGGKFSKRFVRNVGDALLSATHGFQPPPGDDFPEHVVRKAVDRMTTMVAVLSTGYSFTWSAEIDQVVIVPIEGGDAAQVWRNVALWAERDMWPSERWDCMQVLNNSMETCHAAMYAAKWDARTKAEAMAPVSSMETMIEMVATCATRMTQAFLALAPTRLSDVPKAKWEPWLAGLLPTLLPHLHTDTRTTALAQFATTAIKEVYTEASNFLLAERIMASVASIKVDDDGGKVGVGARLHTTRTAPDSEAACKLMRVAVVAALGGAYDRQANAYVGGRRSARRIARAIVAALQPLVDLRKSHTEAAST
jgi:hypothetical protein